MEQLDMLKKARAFRQWFISRPVPSAFTLRARSKFGLSPMKAAR